MKSGRRFFLLAILAFTSAILLTGVFTAERGLAQDAEPTAPEEEKKPEGLNPDRSLPGQEPRWWKSPAKPALDVKEKVLGNGMRILVLNHGEVPVVATNIWYGTGAWHEKPGMTGVAHYLEHMMFKGGEKYAKGEIDAITTRHGGSNNASTSNDFTNYYFRLPASAWTAALDIELDRMTSVALEQKEFDAEKLVVQEEANTAYDDPEQRIWEDVMRAVFGDGHPYSHPVLGYPKDITAMSADDMRRFHDDWYCPENATLVIVGKIDPETAFREVSARFEPVPRGRFPAALPEAKRTSHRAMRRIVRMAETTSPSLTVAFPSDSIRSIRGPCRDVLAHVLAGGENSRLFKRLVLEEKLCQRVSAFEYNLRNGGLFVVSAELMTGADDAARSKVEAAIRAEMEKLATEVPSADEVTRAIRASEVSQVFSLESADGLADKIGHGQVIFGDWRYSDMYLETIRAVQPDDVRQVADDFRWDRDAVVAWLLPRDRATGANPEPVVPELPELGVIREELSNGLTLVMLPMKSGPEVFTLSIRHEAGVRTEPADREGLTALLSATVGTGTATRSRAEINAVFDRNGGSFSAGAGGISAHVLSRDWADALAVAADVMLNASFPEDQVATERQKLFSAIDSLETSHGSLATRAWARAIYGADHPLGRATPSSRNAMAAITRDELLAHHRRFVRPNNTTIVCTGRFEPEAVAAKVKELLGGWEPSKEANFRRSARVDALPRTGTQFFTNKDFAESRLLTGTATIAIDHADKAQCIIRVGRVGITRDHPDWFACMVLDNILGTSPAFSDRFSRILRDEMGLAYSVYANIANSSTEEPGALIAYIATRPESVRQSLEGMRAIMRGIQAEEVTPEEFARAKNYLISSTLLGLEGSGAMAGLIQDIERYDLGYDWLRQFAAGIQAVTREQVLECAKRHLGPDGLVTVVAGPLDRIPDGREFLSSWNIADDPPAGVQPVEGSGNGGSESSGG